MAGQKGRDLVLRVETAPGSGVYNKIGGLRTNEITINNELVDITSKDDAGKRKLLENAGVNSISVSGAGVFTDDSNFHLFRAAAQNNSHINAKLVVTGDSVNTVYTGAWAIPNYSVAGEYNGEVTYSLTLESSGTITVGTT